jgi:hypothetical protein
MSNRCKSLVLSFIMVAGCLPLAAQTYTLQTFSIPYAPGFSTYALGINNRGAIAGYFEHWLGGPFRGFKRDANGVVEGPIDDPNAGVPLTVPSGINDSGVIVGYYGATRNFFGGFVLDHGVFTNVAIGTSTLILGINNAGDFVGSFDGHGFVSNHGVVSQIDFPGGGLTSCTGIATDGTIVGDHIDIFHRSHGFLRGPAGQFKAFQISGKFTTANGVNNAAHQIVGSYGKGHGYVYDYITGLVTTVDWPDPNTHQTVITGVNSQGVIVGWAQIKDPQKGLQPPFSFIGTPQ